MTERRRTDIIKCGSMVKRSQNKKRFTPVNYKTRWFELTKHYLSYFDVEHVEVSDSIVAGCLGGWLNANKLDLDFFFVTNNII
jgi:hypothetical protein